LTAIGNGTGRQQHHTQCVGYRFPGATPASLRKAGVIIFTSDANDASGAIPTAADNPIRISSPNHIPSTG
jgi:hypothetical protein